ncbi:LnmK family bifunctional acyltransferase/decarboxylase [Ruegeria sp. HKCCA6948]|uniref:LnmK family bifunctional acyltransferase/decarboxylase n=1 Tax=unclassified Ruegeria TaxID=2625375 RepID=UPI00353026C8
MTPGSLNGVKDMEMTMERIEQTNIRPFTKPAFRLGMPHMDFSGVSREWLLREACHLHWESIAGDFGAHPKEFRDKSGARVLPSVVACTLNGDAELFKEGDLCQFFQVEKPKAENGWRSQVDLFGNAVTLRAEIITSFARRNGPANRDLVRADMEEGLQPFREGEQAKRANTIRLLGKSERTKAEMETAPPHLTFAIDRYQHLNGVGLVYFAEIHKMITMAERNAAPDLVVSWPMRNRRVHYFCNLDVGDRLELTTETSLQALSPTASVVVRTFAKRSSDGAVVACAEAIYGAAI